MQFANIINFIYEKPYLHILLKRVTSKSIRTLENHPHLLICSYAAQIEYCLYLKALLLTLICTWQPAAGFSPSIAELVLIQGTYALQPSFEVCYFGDV